MKEQTDSQLVQEFVANGGEPVFAELVQRHGPMVLGVCRRVLSNHQDAEDAFQKTFVLLARKAGSIRKQESVGSWLYGAAYKTATRLRSREWIRSAREKEVIPILEAHSSSEHLWAEMEPFLDEELNHLPEKFRMPLVACYLEGKTYGKAAEEIGWSYDLLRGRLNQARDALRRRLERRGVLVSAAFLSAFLSEGVSAPAIPAGLINTNLKLWGAAAAGKAQGGAAGAGFSFIKKTVEVLLMKKTTMTVIVLAGLGIGAGTGIYYGESLAKTNEMKREKAASTVPGDGVAGMELEKLRRENSELQARLEQGRIQETELAAQQKNLERLESENEELKQNQPPPIVIPGSPGESGRMVGRLAQQSYQLTRKYNKKIPGRDSPHYNEYIRELDELMRNCTAMFAVLGNFEKQSPAEKADFSASTMTEALSLEGSQVVALRDILNEHYTLSTNPAASKEEMTKQRGLKIKKILRADQLEPAMAMFGDNFSDIMITLPKASKKP